MTSRFGDIDCGDGAAGGSAIDPTEGSSSEPMREPGNAGRVSGRRAYVPPLLRSYGGIASLTAGGNDGMFAEGFYQLTSSSS